MAFVCTTLTHNSEVRAKLALNRIVLHRSKKSEMIAIHKREVANLLNQGLLEKARIRVSSFHTHRCFSQH